MSVYDVLLSKKDIRQAEKKQEVKISAIGSKAKE